ncbi:MAG TPA: PP2C family protein-serine/threonine phosphatase, partial [Candidatus Omnitrophota bacterium]|nr:PP2C family protein-serine/threonine phosphatase [Candidatus Omnitrophota bacterium]
GTSLFRYARGGDYHDLFVPPGDGLGRMAVAVGDVAGHDLQSAKLMGLARDFLRTRPALPGALGEMIGAVNRDLIGHMKAGRFMTLFLAVLVAETRSIHWVNAGQGAAIAYSPETDSFREVSGPDIPLGIDPDWQFHELSHTGWSTGALLAVGTDGVWETRDASGEMYGTERLCRALRQACARPAAEIVAAVTADLAAFRGARPQEDDLTLVVVKAV